ncbi:hypothetical protein A3K64_01065 [Candidatus Micrarchaeota archaeon RBG_16_36_9]|nr:MAG: hypothetical protein A3K64_01065 [Candidatus Micrarchaeota archaeon RBG_16_36_9]
MAIDINLLWLGLALLIAPVLGTYAKVVKDKRGFVWLTGAGVLYLLASAFSVEISWIPSGLSYGIIIFSIIALIATFIGALMVAADVFR